MQVSIYPNIYKLNYMQKRADLSAPVVDEHLAAHDERAEGLRKQIYYSKKI
jgi:hypothetical protein